MPTPHGGELIRFVGTRGRIGRVLRASDQLDAHALRGGALGEIDALVVVRDAAADDAHLRLFKLAEENILIRHAGAQGVDHVHAYDHLLCWGARGREEEDRCEENCHTPAPFCAAHATLPDDREGVKIRAVTAFQRRLPHLNTIELSKFCFLSRKKV
jgi:hypothetical protein